MLASVAFTLLILAGTQRLAEYRSFWALPEAARTAAPPPRSWFGLSFDTFFPGRQPFRSPGGQGAAPGFPEGVGPGGGPLFEVDTESRIAHNFEVFRYYQDESFILGVVLASLVSIALALWLSRRIAAPLVRVSDAATEVAAGNLGVRVPLTAAQRRSDLETLRLTENFNLMAESLENYEEERKAMIADIAHELRTPLTAMKLRLQALEDGLLPLDSREAQSLNRSTDLLIRLVEDLRTLSLADAGRLELKPGSIDVVGITRNLIEDHGPRLDARNVTAAVEAPEGGIAAVVDPDRFRQILGNLLDNALRVSPDGGSIAVVLEAGGDELRLSVSDEGPGLPPGAAELAFRRFVQGKDLAYTRDPGGSSGLGLAIVEALVRLHGGRVTAGNYDGGARFEVVVPLAGGKREAAG